jgi:hypothetical protein
LDENDLDEEGSHHKKTIQIIIFISVPTNLFSMAEEHQILLQIGGSEDEPPAKKSVPRFSQIPRKGRIFFKKK